MWKAIVLTLIAVASPVLADWTEPARGTATRKALMDALRPHAEWQLGRPVEFVADTLRQSGDLAFAMVSAQRPGGGRIVLIETPGYFRNELSPEMDNATEFQALYRKVGDTWVAVHWALGATDVWFSWEPLCREYRPVIEEWCPN